MKTFIGEYIIPSTGVCDDLISYFKDSPDKKTGHVGYEGKKVIRKHDKDSTDLETPFGRNKLIDKYIKELQSCLNDYKKEYVFSEEGQFKYGLVESVNIQHYTPGQAFHKWHYERNGANKIAKNRHLVFMTYLNNVTDKGGTEFYYQGVCVQPEKGLTLIWPADWTHTHRGVPSKTQEKYIITGWYSYFKS